MPSIEDFSTLSSMSASDPHPAPSAATSAAVNTVTVFDVGRTGDWPWHGLTDKGPSASASDPCAAPPADDSAAIDDVWVGEEIGHIRSVGVSEGAVDVASSISEGIAETVAVILYNYWILSLQTT